MRSGTMILGIGAQKAGTTWLYQYLKNSKGFFAGPLKEYHVWDALTLPNFGWARAGTMQAMFSKHARLRRRMQQDVEFYFDWFTRALQQDDVQWCADITPAYSGLDAETLAIIRNGFKKRSVPLRVVFLIRDPFERCVSAVRMYQSRGCTEDGTILPKTLDEAVAEYSISKAALLRGEYHRTIQAAEQVFTNDELYVGLYEELFTPSGLEKLCGFLGLPLRIEETSIRVNEGKENSDEVASCQTDFVRNCSEIYSFCATRFPQIRTVWKSAIQSDWERIQPSHKS